jgi:hypothetical protein
MDRRVAPILTSFGGAGCESSRLPLHFAPPVSPTISIQVAPDAHPPAPAGQLSESPRIRSIRFAFFESPDCSVYSLLASSIDQSPSRPGSCSLDVADSVRSELPRNFLPRLIHNLLPQVAPASTATAKSMITPWLNRTLHPRLAPRMNLRYQSGTSNSDLASSAFSISIISPQSADHELQAKTVTCAFHQARATVPVSYRVTS